MSQDTDVKHFFLQIPNLGFNKKELDSVVQSHRAFLSAKSACIQDEQVARVVIGEGVSEAESDDPEQYIGVRSVTSEAGKMIVKKR